MSRCTSPLTWCIPPPNCYMVCLEDLAAGGPPYHSFFPFTRHFANPRWWQVLGMAPFHPTIQPRFMSRTSPTSLSTAPLLCNGSGGPPIPPPFISSEPPLRTKAPPPHGVTGDIPANPNRFGPSHPPLKFVDGNGYIVLWGVAESRGCEVGWGKLMRAWGSDDEKVMGKSFELLFNGGRT